MTIDESEALLLHFDPLFKGALRNQNVRPQAPYYDDLLQELRLAVYALMLKYPDPATFCAAWTEGLLFVRCNWLTLDLLRRMQQERSRPTAFPTESDEPIALTTAPDQDLLTLDLWCRFWESLAPADQKKLLALLQDARDDSLDRNRRYKYRQRLRNFFQLFRK